MVAFRTQHTIISSKRIARNRRACHWPCTAEEGRQVFGVLVTLNSVFRPEPNTPFSYGYDAVFPARLGQSRGQSQAVADLELIHVMSAGNTLNLAFRLSTSQTLR